MEAKDEREASGPKLGMRLLKLTLRTRSNDLGRIFVDHTDSTDTASFSHDLVGVNVYKTKVNDHKTKVPNDEY